MESDIQSKERLLKLATYASTVTALLLVLVKLAATLWTGSISVAASLMDSLMDALASFINLLAVRVALKPADAEHRFGHGKVESLAGLGQSAFIAGSAVFLILHALNRLIHPQPLQEIGAGVLVMLFSVTVTLLLLTFQRYVIQRTGSVIIRADSLHYKTDVLTHASIIIALIMSHFGLAVLDSLIAIGIVLYILKSAWDIGYDSIQALMDHELPDGVQEQIRDLALGHAEVYGLHEMRTRQSGLVKFIQLHLELDPEISLKQAHRISEEVETTIQQAFPEADILIHQDMAGLKERHATVPPPGVIATEAGANLSPQRGNIED